MATYQIVETEGLENQLTDMANALREATGENRTMTLPEMVSQIRNLPILISNTASGNPVAVTDSLYRKLQGLKLFGRTTQNGTPTPEAPVPLVSAGDEGSIGITVAGKNLMNLPQSVYKSDNAWHWDLFAGTVGVETAVPADKLELLPILKAGIDYSFSYTIAEGAIDAVCNLQKVNEDGTTSWGNIISFGPGTVRVAQDTRVTVRAELNGHYTIENIQLEIGSTVTAYEPYSAQIITVSTPNGLPGIPVSSGGNYTDETGQQWVCDEVDFARGVYVQRVLSEVFDNADGWSTVGTENGRKIFFLNRYVEVLKKASAGDVTANLLCSNFQNKTPNQIWAGEQGICVDGGGFIQISYGEIEQTIVALGAYLTNHPVTFMAELATPVETALSAEELAAYAALHTNYPNTTIFNDGGAGMEVSYVADTKNYIDNQIAAVAAAIVNA